MLVNQATAEKAWHSFDPCYPSFISGGFNFPSVARQFAGEFSQRMLGIKYETARVEIVRYLVITQLGEHGSRSVVVGRDEWWGL